MMRFAPVISLALLVAAMAGVAAPTASGQPVGCGQVITSDTTLTNDLVDCAGDGLVIGRDGITLDLNGHTVAGRFQGFECQSDCLGRHGIDNSRGFAGLTVKNGTIERFYVGVFLHHTERSTFTDLLIRGGPSPVAPVIGVFLLHSHHNRVRRVRSVGADPGILLWQSTRNTIADSSANGSVSIHRGTGLVLYAGSDRNRIADTSMSGDWVGLDVINSNGNRIERSSASGYAANGLTGNRNVVVDSELHAARVHALRVVGSRNRIEGNTVQGEGGLEVDGNRNRLAGNAVRDAFFGGIVVRSGDRNVLEGNGVFNSRAPSYGIHIQPGPTRTFVLENFVTDSEYDGIRVEAPGTVVGRNTANDNGELGINAVLGTVDAGRNSASGNGNPLECVNVLCR